VILLRIRGDRADEFERFFERENVPNWHKHAESGGFLAASLARVESAASVTRPSVAVT